MNVKQNTTMSAIEIIKSFLIKSEIKCSLNENVAIDGGFFKGRFSLLLNKSIKELFCYGFEPNDEFFNLWQNKSSEYNQITLYPQALSDQCGVADIYLSKSYPGTSSLLPRPSIDSNIPYYPLDATFQKKQSVETTTVDFFCEKKGINSVFLLKLDLQGGELKALIGAKRMLESNSIQIIYTEAVFVQKYKDQPLMVDLWNLLLKYGYRLHSIYDMKSGDYNNIDCMLRGNQLNQCNCLFVSKSMARLFD